MSELQVLCATMHQTDFSKVKEMNIQSDVIFANQADRFSCKEMSFGPYIARMVTTDFRGVGKNRNLALALADADICLLADDDLRYVDGYREKVIAAFKEVPTADIIIFNYHSSSRERPVAENKRVKRLSCFVSGKYGAVRIAFRLRSIQKAGIWFSNLFGGGAAYCSGEDSLFLRDAFRRGLKVYSHPLVISESIPRESTWFSGYNEEYFFGKGAYCQAAMPLLKYAVFLRYLVRLRKRPGIPCARRAAMLLAGAAAYRKGISYRQWEEENTAE